MPFLGMSFKKALPESPTGLSAAHAARVARVQTIGLYIVQTVSVSGNDHEWNLESARYRHECCPCALSPDQ